MKPFRAFTLIELIIVVAILSILAVVAVPKFIDIQGKAQIASLQGLQEGLDSAVILVYSRSLIEGTEQQATGSIQVDGLQINTAYGYPHPWWFNSIRRLIYGWEGFAATTDINVNCSNDFCGFGGIDGNRSESIPNGPQLKLGELGTAIWPKGYSGDDQCLVYYIHPRVLGVPPRTGLITVGC